MRSKAAIGIALTALRANKLRSALTALGVIIGVGSVVTMLALGRGASADVQERVSSMGINRLTIWPGQAQAGRIFGGMGSSDALKPTDVEAILQKCPSVVAATPTVNANAQVKWHDMNTNTSIQGVNESYLQVNNQSVSTGSFFSARDVESNRRVCVLGTAVIENLFGKNDPIGQKVRINNIPFQVTGILKQMSGGGFRDPNDVIVIPVSVAMNRLFGRDYVNQIAVTAVDNKSLDEARDEITAVLMRRHRIKSPADMDFNVRTQTEILDTFSATSRTLTILLASIAAVSLLVGGIGVMNIMLVSVTERTREIGIRKAVGAKRTDILRQFLIEAVSLCIIGGVTGAGIGTGAAKLVSHFAGWRTMVTADSIIVACLFSAAVGIGFGLYPAQRAAKLNPIEALRYE